MQHKEIHFFTKYPQFTPMLYRYYHFPCRLGKGEKLQHSRVNLQQGDQLLHLCGFQGKSTGVGCHVLLQGIFPTQGSNPGLPHCRQTLYRLSHQGSGRFSSVALKLCKCIKSYGTTSISPSCHQN